MWITPTHAIKPEPSSDVNEFSLNCIQFSRFHFSANLGLLMTEQPAIDVDALGGDHVYRSIREQILTGVLPSGEWLREGDLASALGVSRTPVREAFRRLATEGLVHHERNRGVQVATWSLHDLDEIFSLRTELEPWACGLAAISGDADVEELRMFASEMDVAAARPSPDIDRITDLNNHFHRAILTAAGNSRLSAVLLSLVQIPLVRRTFSHYSPEVLHRSLAHHHEIVEALAARDSAWATSVMRSHVRSAWASIRESEQHHLGWP